MSKINISFYDADYSIDESDLATAASNLQSHLSTVMNGSGAVINLGGISYNVDSTKLSTATNDFVSHLRTVAGNGSKVVVGGVEYSVDSAKVQDAISDLETVLGNLHNPDSDESGFYVEDNEAGGQTAYIIDVNALLSSEDNEFGGQTAVIN